MTTKQTTRQAWATYINATHLTDEEAWEAFNDYKEAVKNENMLRVRGSYPLREGHPWLSHVHRLCAAHGHWPNKMLSPTK
jgi:hypothetical protein